MTTSHETEDRDDHRTTDESGIRVLNSRDLFKGARELYIKHGEFLYRLRITRQGKLILNK